MTDRPRLPIPLGGGLDRESGLYSTNASTMQDLRNVHLLNGRVEIRKGLGRAANFGGGTLLNVHPVRSRSLAAYLVKQADGRIALWQSAADGSGITELVVMLAPDPDASTRYILADIYDKIFIAHDEPDILLREPTRYWDFRTNDLHLLQMPALSGPVMKFRGVADHLAYMLGWGWGDGDDEDRAEVLRISLPGDPTTFDPKHYLIVGLRGEPITGGGRTGKFWSIKKLTHGHVLVGDNRANFGAQPVEDHIGLPQHHLGVSVNGVYYFWSSDGPRRETGGAESEDLSAGLRLLDVQPDVLTDADTETGFAVYDPTRREVLFVFGAGAYVYHLATNPERWSYREYGVALGCGAVLYSSTTGALVVPPDPAYLFTIDPIGVFDEGAPDPAYDFTIDPIV